MQHKETVCELAGPGVRACKYVHVLEKSTSSLALAYRQGIIVGHEAGKHANNNIPKKFTAPAWMKSEKAEPVTCRVSG